VLEGGLDVLLGVAVVPHHVRLQLVLAAESCIALDANVRLLVSVHRHNVSSRVARLLEFHLAHGAHVVLVNHRQVGVGDHFGVVFRLIVPLAPLLFRLFRRRPAFFALGAFVVVDTGRIDKTTVAVVCDAVAHKFTANRTAYSVPF